MNNQPSNTVKGYKVTKPDGSANHGSEIYKVGETYTMDKKPELCATGYHFCQKVADCFNYYQFDPKNLVFEVEASGDIEHGDDKSATNKLSIIKQLTWEEMLGLANEGAGNTGLRNTGNSNTGNSNTGDSNTGNSNTGNSNTGDWNTGNRNTGYRNTGYSNTGDWNTGYRNTGYSNTGNSNTGNSNTGYSNTGYSNTGNSNTGNSNTGNSNTGDSNTGDWNTGNRNTGYRNTGYSNTGDWNTGYRNTGYSNTGNSNTGNSNTGDWNTGYRNTGYSNTGNRNTGAFCTIDAPFPMFNKKSDWTEEDFKNSRAYSLMCNHVDTKQWVPSSVMTEEEKTAHPSHKTADGYLKDIPFKEAFQNAWHNWNAVNRAAFTTLPNFSAKVFFDITGVDINKK